MTRLVLALLVILYLPLAVLAGESIAMLVYLGPAVIRHWATRSGRRRTGTVRPSGRNSRTFGSSANTARRPAGKVIGRNIPLIINLGLFSIAAALIAIFASDTNQRIIDSIAGTAVIRT